MTVNADECLLTRMQEMSLDYHFTVEQEVGSATHAFFGFNGNSLTLYSYIYSSKHYSYKAASPVTYAIHNIRY